MTKINYKLGEPVYGTVDKYGKFKMLPFDVNLYAENNKNVGVVTKVTKNSMTINFKNND